MTERVYNAEQLSGLPEHGVEALKIRALFNAYGGSYDFCRFFRQGDTFLAGLDGSFVISEGAAPDWDELAGFLNMHGFTDIFCSERAGEKLQNTCNAEFARVNLMELTALNGSGAAIPECSPSEAWKIISTRFPIEFEPWYLDISHRVRHGVSRCVSDGRAALVIQHSIGGETLISQVAVLPEMEHKGCAGGLIRSVCASVGGTIQAICEDSLTGFYEKCDFTRRGSKFCAVRN